MSSERVQTRVLSFVYDQKNRFCKNINLDYMAMRKLYSLQNSIFKKEHSRSFGHSNQTMIKEKKVMAINITVRKGESHKNMYEISFVWSFAYACKIIQPRQ
jgi:hypothetical protein